MQTEFTSDQYRDPEIRAADEILRKCVHCGLDMVGTKPPGEDKVNF